MTAPLECCAAGIAISIARGIVPMLRLLRNINTASFWCCFAHLRFASCAPRAHRHVRQLLPCEIVLPFSRIFIGICRTHQ